MPARQTRRVLLSRLFLPSGTTSVLRTRNCGTTSESSDTITPLRRTMSKGWGPSVISYGRSLSHSRRGRKSPMTRTWMRPHLRQVALGVVQMKQTAILAMMCPWNLVTRAQVHKHGLLAISLKGPQYTLCPRDSYSEIVKTQERSPLRDIQGLVVSSQNYPRSNEPLRG